MIISYDILQSQNAVTSQAVIQYLQSEPSFQQLASYEGQLTQQRDTEDDEKLDKGIQYAQQKGVIDPHYVPEPYITVDVLQQTPAVVADTILQYVQNHPMVPITSTTNTTDGGDGVAPQVEEAPPLQQPERGYVIVLVGLSGTGKGTTVSELVQKLQHTGHQVVTWSNGNIFRSVTLLATTWWEQEQEQQSRHGTTTTTDDASSGGSGAVLVSSSSPFDPDIVLTKTNLEWFMSMLSFQKNPTTQQYDTRICGLGYDTWVSTIQNTELKQPKVSKCIPTVAEMTQVR
jgi:cytidylate kinase